MSISDGAYQIVVCAESKVIVESADMETAVFNIAYPKTLNALNTLLIFFQHHIFKISDDQPEPNSVAWT